MSASLQHLRSTSEPATSACEVSGLAANTEGSATGVKVVVLIASSQTSVQGFASSLWLADEQVRNSIWVKACCRGQLRSALFAGTMLTL